MLTTQEAVYDDAGRVTYSTFTHEPGLSAGGTSALYDASGSDIRDQQLAGLVIGTSTDVHGITSSYVVCAGIEEFTGTGTTPTLSYVEGDVLLGQATGTAFSWFLMDGQNSTRQLADASGNISERYHYDAFGNLLNFSGTPATSILYTGQQLDRGAGTYNLRARLYDPRIGRFTSSDPFPGYLNAPLTLHHYGYCLANPINWADPSGYLPNILSAAQLPIAARTISGSTSIIFAAAVSGLTGGMSEAAATSAMKFGAANLTVDAANTLFLIDSVANEEPTGKSIKNLKLKRIHSDETLSTGSNKYSLDHWRKQSTEDIVKSLKPGEAESLKVKPDGRIWNGNTRSKVLEERGYDINSLPRDPVE